MAAGKNFSAEQITLWLGGNLRGILFFLGLSLFAGLAWTGYSEWRGRQEAKAYNKLYDKRAALQKADEKANGKGFGRGEDLIYSKEMGARAEDLEKALAGLKSFKAAAAFAIGLADFYRRHKKPERARAAIAPFARPGRSSSIYQLASFQLAAYLMDARLCSEAIPILEALAENKKAAPFHREAYLQMGLCREEQNQDSEAAALYRKVLAGQAENKDGAAALLAREYLRLLKLKPILEGGG